MQRFFLVCSVILCGCTGVFANTALQNILEEYDEGFSSFMEQTYITRFDMTKYLAATRCRDCMVPDEEMIAIYDAAWLADTQKKIQYNIDDIQTKMIYNNNNYYYCVADTTERGLMYGYPRNTSPYCSGQFCGESTARYIELVESLYRLVRGTVYEKYEANRSDIEVWLDENISTVPVARHSVIKERAQTCGEDACVFTTPRELDIYMYYCSRDMRACNLPSYAAFPSDTWPKGPFTLLVRENIIPTTHAQAYSLHDFIEPDVFFSYLEPVHALQGCRFEVDYDGDNRINTKDNCPLAYNPHQRNTDGDVLGNVCDADIDNDGIPNPLYIVNDADIINPRLWRDSEDKSLFLAGDEEQDTSAESRTMALRIDADPLVGSVPLTVSFSQEYIGSLDQLQWDFGDGSRAVGLNPKHLYTDPGLYVVKATATMFDNKKIVAKIAIEVLPNIDTQVACAASLNTTDISIGDEVVFSDRYAGNAQKMVRQIDGEVITVDPGETVGYIFDKAGRYPVELQCYNGYGEWAGLSQFDVYVSLEDEYRAFLEASEIYVPAGRNIDLTNLFDGFDVSDVRSVIWDMGDGNVIQDDITYTYQYEQVGAYLVKQSIFFNNESEPLENSLTIYVYDETVGQTITMDGELLVASVGEPFTFALTPINIDTSDISYLTWECGDVGMTSEYTDDIQQHLLHECVYAQPGSKRVQSFVYTTDGSVYPNEMSVYVLADTACLDNLAGYVCDMDEDGFPDVCDDDIDGDGVPNCLALLTREQEACVINQNNINRVLLDNCYDAIRDGAEFDNCPFRANPEQEDSDGDAYGDVCDTASTDPDVPVEGGVGSEDSNVDSDDTGSEGGGGNNNTGADGDDDSDGIENASDACSGIPESADGKQDADGCPELPDPSDESWPENPFVEADGCTSCPCPHADYGSELWKGDRIRAILLDEAGEIIYRYTSPKIIEADIPDEMLGG